MLHIDRQRGFQTVVCGIHFRSIWKIRCWVIFHGMIAFIQKHFWQINTSLIREGSQPLHESASPLAESCCVYFRPLWTDFLLHAKDGQTTVTSCITRANKSNLCHSLFCLLLVEVTDTYPAMNVPLLSPSNKSTADLTGVSFSTDNGKFGRANSIIPPLCIIPIESFDPKILDGTALNYSLKMSTPSHH